MASWWDDPDRPDMPKDTPGDVTPAPAGAYTGPIGRTGFAVGNPAAAGTPEEELYRQGSQGLQGFAQGLSGRMAPYAEQQAEAARVLGARAQNLAGGQAALGMAATREQLEARAATPQAILGGAIGAGTAQQAQGLAQEAAQRQAAFAQAVSGLGTASAAQAGLQRQAEAAMLQDLQTRYQAALSMAAAQQQQFEAAKQRQIGASAQGIGTVLGAVGGAFAGDPLTGAQIGSKVGGAVGKGT